MLSPNVVVIGDANVDMVIRLPNRTTASPDLSQSEPQLHGGGSAANVAVALARLGVNVNFIGTVGDDGYGRWVREDFEREGVNTQALYPVSDVFTPMVMALIEPDGERLVVIWPPENGAHLHLQSFQFDENLISSASWLHTSGICLRGSPAREAILYAMELARNAGLTVSLDLNLRVEVWGFDTETRKIFERAIELSDVIFGSAAEEIMIIADANSVEVGAQKISKGIRTVIARQGEDGALVATPQEMFHVPAFEVQVVDTLGAGDAFDGGYIAAKLRGTDVREAIRWGHAAAAIKIGRAGARGLASLEELKQLLSQR